MLGKSFVLALLALLAMARAQWTAPAFYKGLEGPKYKVEKTLTVGGMPVELRAYEAGAPAAGAALGNHIHPPATSCMEQQAAC